MSRLISFVIPCYGSEKTIEFVVNEIEMLHKQHLDDDYEIILVNDCSPDGVWDVISRLSNENDNVMGINLAKNFGQHAALLAGYRQSKGDIIVSLDDDGQTAIEEVYTLINKMNEGYDVVYATYRVKQHSKFRNLGSRFTKLMTVHLMGVPKNITGSSFYVMRHYLAEEISKYKNPYVFLSGLIFRSTNNVTEVYVNHRARKEGRSGYTLKKLLTLWVNGATTFSVKPLRISMVCGIVVAIIGLICSCIVVVEKIMHPSIAAGWSSLMAVLLVLSGSILVTLGIVGEYIGRTYMSLNSAPQYVVREITEKKVEGEKDSE